VRFIKEKINPISCLLLRIEICKVPNKIESSRNHLARALEVGLMVSRGTIVIQRTSLFNKDFLFDFGVADVLDIIMYRRNLLNGLDYDK
jgi:hypothetical protein